MDVARRLLLVPSLGLIALLVAAGCSDSSAQGPQEAFSDRYGQLLAGGLDSAEQAEIEAILFREVQNELARCMEREGFDYIPENDPARFQTPPRSFFTREDAETHGYGIVAGLRDADRAAELSENDEYLKQLDPANRAAYYESLEGTEVGPEPAGCLGAAQDTSFERLGITEVNARLSAGALLDVEGDARLVAADQEWRRCVADLGISSDSSTIPEFVADLQTEFSDGPALSGEEGAVDDFQQREIDLAVLMLDCNSARNDVLVRVTSEAIAGS